MALLIKVYKVQSHLKSSVFQLYLTETIRSCTELMSERMSAGKPPGEDDVKKSETSEINQKKKSATAAKCLGTLNAVEVERVQVSSEVITGTPSTLADLPSTEMQSLLRPQNPKQLTAIMEDDEAFRWRGTAFEKAAATSSPQAETTTGKKKTSLTFFFFSIIIT